MKQTNKKKGFTIVELVIVIAVIGILSAVLIPTFSGLINKANKTALQEGLTNAYTAYAADEYTDGASLKSKEELYFSTDATLTENSVVYKFDVDKNEYVLYTTNVTTTLEALALKPGASESAAKTAIQYNGYYAFTLKAGN